MKMKTLVTILLAMALVFFVAMVPTYAAELPEGVVSVYKVANDGNTRNEDWKDLSGECVLCHFPEFSLWIKF